MVINENKVIYADNIPMYYLTCLIHLENKLNGKYTAHLINSRKSKGTLFTKNCFTY